MIKMRRRGETNNTPQNNATIGNKEIAIRFSSSSLLCVVAALPHVPYFYFTCTILLLATL